MPPNNMFSYHPSPHAEATFHLANSEAKGRTTTGRIVILDILRGFLLVVMTVDHLPGKIADFVYEFPGYVSSAEGFVFLSGLVAGWVYAAPHLSSARVAGKSVRRALILYLSHLALVVTIWILLPFLQLSQSALYSWRFSGRPGFLRGILTFSVQPKYLDILPMYCVFVLCIPILLFACARARHWLVFLISGGIWFAAQFGFWDKLEATIFGSSPHDTGFFNLLAWQFLFCAGVALAHVYRERPGNIRRAAAVLFIPAAQISIVLLVLKHFFNSKVEGNIFSVLTSKADLGALRLLNFFCLCSLLFTILQKCRFFDRLPFFGFIGRFPLLVFCYHVVVIYVMNSFLRSAQLTDLVTCLLVVAAALSLAVPPWIVSRVGNFLGALKISSRLPTQWRGNS